jgi:hypothetical protein
VALLGALGLSIAAGCTITSTDNSSNGSTSGDPTTSAGNGGSTSASTTASTGETTTTATTGTGGSGGGCVSHDGTGVTEAACDEMNITPVSHGGTATLCQDDSEPLGHDVCHIGFGIWTAGAFEVYQACAAEIGVEPANACDEAQVVACLNEMYDSVCVQTGIGDACQAIDDFCEGVEDSTFDVAVCSADLNPFSDAGLQKYEDCFNANPNITCAEAHELCFAEVQTQ